MNIISFKTTKIAALACAILFLGSCAKTTVIFDNDEHGNSSQPDNSNGSGGDNDNNANTLVMFNASIESRNMTRAMSPMKKGIQNQLFAFDATSTNSTVVTPIAQGLYLTTAPGVLTGNAGYKMYLTNGIYNFYAVSDNFSTIPPYFSTGKSEPLFNGIDYLWWSSPQHDITSTQVSIPIVYLHVATQVVIKVSEGDGIKLDRLVSATITTPEPGASMNLSTGVIPPTSQYSNSPDKMGVNGLLAQYTMLPLKTTTPMNMTLEVVFDGEINSHTYSVEVPVPDGELKAGNSYVFNAVINANTISFSSVNIKAWTEVDETGKPLYPSEI